MVLHFSENCMILALAVFHNTLALQTDRQTDRRHTMTIVELAIQLQRSAN